MSKIKRLRIFAGPNGAIKVSDRSFLFDNSDEMELIAETLNGEIILHKDAEFLPNWFIQYVINKIV